MGNWEEIGSANTVSSENIGTVTGVTASEVANSVYQETGGGLLMELSVTSTTSAAAYPVRERLWINFDDGRGDVLIGDKYASGSSTTWVIGVPNQQTGITVAPQDAVWVPTDPTKINWRATVEANSMAPTPSGAAAHYDFTVTPAQAASSTDITGIQLVPNAQTGDTIIYTLNGDPGVWFYIWNLLQYTQPAVSGTIAGGDPYFKSSFCTKQLGYAVTGNGTVTSGTNFQSTAGAAFAASDVGSLITIGSTIARIASYTDSTHVTLDRSVANGSGQPYEVWHPAPASIFGDEGADDEDALAQGYWGRKFTDGPAPSALGSTVAQFPGTPSWNIPPDTLPDGSANPYKEMRIWVWAVSRLADNEAGGGAGTITLQYGWPGAANHGSLFPVKQSAALDLTRTKASTLGAALGKEVGTGRLKVNIGGATPLAVNGSNELYVPIANDFVVQNIGGVWSLSQNFVNLAKAVGFDTSIFGGGGGSSLLTINALAVNKLAAGDALFAGQATFATSGGGKVIINSSGVTIQNKITSPTASVTIGSSSVVITGSAGTLTADSGGVTIANGSSSVQVTSAAVTINNGSFTATAGTITVNVDSSNYVLVTNSGSTIWAQHQYAYFRVQRSTDSLWYGQLSLANLQLSTSGGGNSLSLTPTSFSMTGLPSSNPGAGSKQFWYDPSDGNRVKFAA